MPSGSSDSALFCDRSHTLTATEQDRLLRFAAVVRQELEDGGPGAALVSRSGLDLSRFDIRYSHGAIAWRNDTGTWTARQLYYACNESRPRLYDQGLAGFTMGTDEPSLGYVSVVRVPARAAARLDATVLDTPRMLELLAARYSADAYPFSTRYQNCNQWVIEALALAWGDVTDGDDLRGRAQQWLQQSGYRPEPVRLGSRLVLFASLFVPLLHLDDHPDDDIRSLELRISLPSTIETFVRDTEPEATRVEICHDARQVVVHRGWTPIAAGCVPGPGDRVVPFDD